MPQPQRPPSEFDAIAILVEKIKHPQWSLEKLAIKLKGKNQRIEPLEPQGIENLFLHQNT